MILAFQLIDQVIPHLCACLFAEYAYDIIIHLIQGYVTGGNDLNDLKQEIAVRGFYDFTDPLHREFFYRFPDIERQVGGIYGTDDPPPPGIGGLRPLHD